MFLLSEKTLIFSFYVETDTSSVRKSPCTEWLRREKQYKRNLWFFSARKILPKMETNRLGLRGHNIVVTQILWEAEICAHRDSGLRCRMLIFLYKQS